ncbi:uncharacterized protein LOC107859369 isoform X2 [Capsicum annuum]|uniref:uncharacterized protein LOC107859369 isoform X2 n=1 Tax=Capsicum annuum TaxID=4072 RepID=UPI0007BECF0F|nr:uncharacterized protein LOC107859369 isoform X2 [Capsicum annuum]
MESKEELSSAKAVLVGALAPGVNAPTWNTLKIAFLMLVVCLIVMLGFLAETGFVSVEHQMEELGLAPKDEDTSKKTS